MNVLARLVTRLSAHPGAAAATVAFGVGTLGAGVGLSATSGYLIAMASLMPGIAALQVAVTGVRAFGLARGALRYGERLSGHGLSLELLSGLRLSLFDALERRSPALLMHRGGELLHRWVQDVDSLRDVYVRGLHAPLLSGLVFALAALGMLLLAPRLALVFAGWFFLSALFLPVLFHRLSKPHQVAATQRRAELSAQTLDLRLGRDELILAGAWERRRAEAKELARRLQAAQGRVAFLHALRDATGVAATSAAVLSVFFLAWPLVSRGQLSGVALVALVLATASFAEAILPVSEALVNWGAHRESARRVFAVEDEPIPVTDPPHPRMTDVPLHAPSIRFQGISFTWPGADAPSLDGLTLEIAPGEHLAVTGASGAGKSTLLSLLVRAHDPAAGAIFLDGMDLREWSLSALRQTISLVSQATWFAPGSLRDNLLLAKPAASDDEMRAAIRESGLMDWLRGLPRGLDAPMGSDGERLSGGERQRLSFARALLRASPVLALDELSANLDRETAREVHERLASLARRQTVLRITHDPALYGGADRILVLGAGKLVEVRPGIG